MCQSVLMYQMAFELPIWYDRDLSENYYTPEKFTICWKFVFIIKCQAPQLLNWFAQLVKECKGQQWT